METNMKHNKRQIIQEQLDAKLQNKHFEDFIDLPPRGWIHAIRNGLGMTIRDLARRMNVSKSLIGQMETNEMRGALTLNSLARVADALDCKLVYKLVQKTTLENTYYKQAIKIAHDRVERVSHTMELEAQGLSDEEKKRLVEKEIAKIIVKMPRDFWASR
ncbi:MAG: putative DNA-binding mobile mystery protein A [Candidatus Omnitrophota bacterium]|jgi:predicted DNA-binding mobile mystery protein A